MIYSNIYDYALPPVTLRQLQEIPATCTRDPDNIQMPTPSAPPLVSPGHDYWLHVRTIKDEVPIFLGNSREEAIAGINAIAQYISAQKLGLTS